LFIILAGSLSACKYFKKRQPEKAKPIARVGDNFLYAEDLEYLFESAIPVTDSAATVKTYIDDWIRKKLLLETATTYLPAEKQNVEKKIQDYREALLIYLYEDELIKQKLDTTVTEEAIDSFYNAYKDNFRLDGNIYKINYIKLPIDAPKIDSIRFLFLRAGNEKNFNRLVNYCYSYATDFYLKDSLWISELSLKNKMPLTETDMALLEKSSQLVEVSDSNYLYLLKNIDIKLKGEPAPIDFVRKDLKFMIINKRKKQLLNNAYDKIYQEAIKDGTFEVF
jgi:hypothetical protein